jgi:hypothetical protein
MEFSEDLPLTIWAGIGPCETAYRESELEPVSARCNEAAQVRQSDIQIVDSESLVQLNRVRPSC